MPFRPLIHIPRGTARILLYATLLSVGLFFAATRTEVGRSVLKSQIERQFNGQFTGQLKIGRLSGNLLYRLTALDVQLLDPAGARIVEIDSVIASPRWRRITQGRVELGRLHLHGMRAQLVKTDGEGWNLTRALRRKLPSDSTGGALKSVTVGDLRILDGSITTSNDGPSNELVEQGVLYDFENSELSIRRVNAIIDWRPTDAQIDLIGLSAHLEDQDVDVVEAQGQIVYNDRTFLANQVSISTTASTLRFTGALDDLAGGDNSDPRIDLDLSADPLNHSELAKLLPRNPFRNTMFVIARVQGPVSAMVVEQLRIGHGRSHIEVEGTVLGAPDSLDFELSSPEAIVRRRDLRAILADPGPLDRTQVDSLNFSVLARGVIHDPFEQPSGSGDFFLDVGGDAGRASGRVSVQREPAEPWLVSSDLFAGELRIDRFLPRIGAPTAMTGDISVSVSGRNVQELDLEAELSLGTSTILGRPVDSLKVLAAADAGKLRAELQVVQGDGQATVRIQADVSDTAQLYSASIATHNLDVGPLLAMDSLQTDITSRIETRFSLSSLNDIVGSMEVSIDSSDVMVPGQRRAIGRGIVQLDVTRPEDNVAALSFSGDVLQGQVDLRGRLSDVISLAKHWRGSVLDPESIRASSADDSSGIQERSRNMDNSQSSGVTLSGSLTAINSSTLSALFPGRPEVATNVTADFQVDADSLKGSVRMGLSGDSLRVGRIRTDEYSGSLFMSADQRVGLLESLSVIGSVSSSRFSAGGSGIPDVSLSLTYRDQAGEVVIDGLEGARVGPLQVSADLHLGGQEIVVTPTRFEVRAGGYDWTLAQGGPITLGSGIIRFANVTVESPSGSQRVQVQGAISDRPEDQLSIVTEQVDLKQVSNILSMRRVLGGRLNGAFVLSRQDNTPIVEAQATIARLGLDERILGDLRVTSSLRPGTSEGVLDLELMPLRATAGSATVVENEATVVGTFRLPSSDSDGSRTDPGILDLTADIKRADLFFFEYIFPGTVENVAGYTTGSVQISGSLSRPVFDADLRIVDGSFRVPRFNLAMRLSADVETDRYGIRIRRANFVDKTGGSVGLTGDVLFNDYKFFSFNLDGRLDEFQIMDVASSRDLPFYGHIWASGTATLTGPLSQTQLRATNARATPESELYIPLVESQEGSDAGFIVFADSTGEIPDISSLTRRRNLLASRPRGERGFTEGMDMELNIEAPEGSTVHLVIDPLLGDVINAVGSGRVQILRREGQFETFGSFQVNSGDYLFTAGEVFVRRFIIEEGGQIVWDGDPTDARLDIPAAFRTRASRAGLQANTEGSASLIPVVVNLQITGRVSAPEVALALNIDRSSQQISNTSDQEFLETILNNPQLSTEYATSVLLTNSFALTTSGTSGSDALGSGAFNSLSQLIAAQLNRYLSSALPNVDFSFGVQGQTSQELDITYGVALRLLDERLVIRGQGVYQGAETSAAESLQGEFVVEVRLSRNVSVEVFYRREGDLLVRTLTSTTGAGLSYRTEFPTWKRFFRRLFGWMLPRRGPEQEQPETVTINRYRR